MASTGRAKASLEHGDWYVVGMSPEFILACIEAFLAGSDVLIHGALSAGLYSTAHSYA